MALEKDNPVQPLVCPLIFAANQRKRGAAQGTASAEVFTLSASIDQKVETYMRELLSLFTERAGELALNPVDGSGHGALHSPDARLSVRRPLLDHLRKEVLGWRDSGNLGDPLQTRLQLVKKEDVDFPAPLRDLIQATLKRNLEKLKGTSLETWKAYQMPLTLVYTELASADKKAITDPEAWAFNEFEIVNYSIQTESKDAKQEPYLREGYSITLKNGLFKIDLNPTTDGKGVEVRIELEALRGATVNNHDLNPLATLEDASLNGWVADLIEGVTHYVKGIPRKEWRDEFEKTSVAPLGTCEEDIQATSWRERVEGLRKSLGDRLKALSPTKD